MAILNNIFLIVGLVLSAIGLVKIDIFLIPTLDYFGKYVFFFLFNIVSLYMVFSLRRYKFLPVVIGVLILSFGFWV